MYTAASRREFDFVLFWLLDRLSRGGIVETLNHLQRLTGCGVTYRSFTEQYLDSADILKEAVIRIHAAVAKQERVRLSERTKDTRTPEGTTQGQHRRASQERRQFQDAKGYP